MKNSGFQGLGFLRKFLVDVLLLYICPIHADAVMREVMWQPLDSIVTLVAAHVGGTLVSLGGLVRLQRLWLGISL